MAIFFIMGGLYLALYINAKQIDSSTCDDLATDSPEVSLYCDDQQGSIYDTYWLSYRKYTDEDEAASLEQELSNWDSDRLQKGSRFTVIYGFCGITFLLIGLANLCTAIGAYNFNARAAGLCCASCLGCINLAAMITTACFRFNTMGKLAALSECPSDYEGTND